MYVMMKGPFNKNNFRISYKTSILMLNTGIADSVTVRFSLKKCKYGIR